MHFILYLLLSLQPGIAASSNCPNGAGTHCTNLSWIAPSNAAQCVSTSTPPCTLGYNVLRGTTSGGESSTPINSALLTTLAYQDPVTLGAASQTFYYEIQAVETTGTLVQTANSTEVSVTFPALLQAPTSVTVSPE